mgnify:CR=1 FL=1
MAVQAKCARWFMLMLVLLIAVTLMSCGSKNKKPTVVKPPVVRVEPSDVYTDAGLQLLEKGQYDDADREFAWALTKNPKNARAAIGRSIARIYQGEYDEALDDLKSGCKYAKQNEDKVFCQVARIRIYTQDKRDKRWFLKAKEAFDAATKIDPQNSDAYFYMGFAFRDSLNFDEAGKMFREVIAINDRHVKEAGIQADRIQKIQGAMASTKTGRTIALADRITRADCAAIIVEEIKLEKILSRQDPNAAPVMDKAKDKKAEKGKTSAKDIAEHPFRVHIEEVLKLGIKGLTKYPDGSFRPEEGVNRAAYAVIMEDILERLTGNTELKKPFQGSPSPFPDVKADYPYYEAVMVVTSRGIMEKKNANEDAFAPLAPLSGAEALLIARKLKEDLKIN